jgi:DNA-binding NarL/FixJ family response regulator
MTGPSVILADDHALVRAGIRALLEAMGGVEVRGETGDGHEALRLIEEIQPDLAILDIGLPGMNGIEIIGRVVRAQVRTRILVLSVHADAEFVRQALHAGAAGYLIKGSAAVELELAVRALGRGETYLSPAISGFVIEEMRLHNVPRESLTPRQREILQLVAEGRSTKEVAARLDLSVKTVESHRSEIMARLGIHDLAGLVRYAIRVGITTTEQ